MYLNFDNPIATANGNGNIQQLGQTKITCKIPANFQENASGSITISDADLIPDLESQFKIFSHLKLQVEQTATAGSPITAATLGEQVSLKVKEGTTLTALTNKFKYDFFYNFEFFISN